MGSVQRQEVSHMGSATLLPDFHLRALSASSFCPSLKTRFIILLQSHFYICIKYSRCTKKTQSSSILQNQKSKLVHKKSLALGSWFCHKYFVCPIIHYGYSQTLQMKGFPCPVHMVHLHAAQQSQFLGVQIEL